MEIEDGSVPNREGARRMTPHKSEACRMLMEYDMIEPSKSQLARGVVMAKIERLLLKFCSDFRYLNAVTIKDAYPNPRFDESLSKLRDAKIFMTLDLGLRSEKTVIRENRLCVRLRLYQRKRMPFGLWNATATFQRLLAQALTNVTKCMATS